MPRFIEGQDRQRDLEPECLDDFLVVGDAEGVVIIPRADVPQVLAAAEKKLIAEKARLEEISRGEPVSPWLDDALRAAGLPGLPSP